MELNSPYSVQNSDGLTADEKARIGAVMTKAYGLNVPQDFDTWMIAKNLGFVSEHIFIAHRQSFTPDQAIVEIGLERFLERLETYVKIESSLGHGRKVEDNSLADGPSSLQ